VTGSCYVAQAGLKLGILLSLPPACWYYRHVITCLALKMHLKVVF
jgi:hypothetical protein